MSHQFGINYGELIVDLFAGGGGASTAIEMATGRSPDIAINHAGEALAAHCANHPDTAHYQEDVFGRCPTLVTGGRPVGLLWLSPTCSHFSKAKGAALFDKKIRALCWVGVRWALKAKPRVIALENVEEFQDYGPLDLNGKPIPEKKGSLFRHFVRRLKKAGYQVEWKILHAHHYGAPTSRKRLFMVARCDGLPIVWPEPTHGPRELFTAQGFSPDYIIDPIHNGKPLTKSAQVRLVGNSVSPPVAAALVRANYIDQANERVA